jgi:hypothetical protein
MTSSAIAVSGLRKTFGNKVVLDGIGFEVAAGSVFSLLGPNGAGKTTAVNVLATLLRADAGTVRVAGYDVATETGIVRELVAEGTTVFLTTQYLEEADRLADRIAVLDQGRLVAQGTPEELKRQIPGTHVRLRFADPADLDAAAGIWAGAVRDEQELKLTLRVPGGERGAVLETDVLQGRAAPQCERLAQQPCALDVVLGGRSARDDEAFEAHRVGGRLLAPDPVDQRGPRDHPAGPQREGDQQSAQPRARHLGRAAVGDAHLQRPQHRDLHPLIVPRATRDRHPEADSASAGDDRRPGAPLP